jgi:hypothetical protein
MNIERMTWGTDHPTAEISGLCSTAERAQLGNEYTCFREFGFGFDQDTIVNDPSLVNSECSRRGDGDFISVPSASGLANHFKVLSERA